MAVLLVVSAGRPVPAQVTVRFEPPTITVGEDQQFTVDIVADIPEVVVGWGLDLTVSDQSIVSLVGSPVIGSTWVPAFTPDGDGLAGVAFPDGVSGTGILLGRLTLLGNTVGEANLTLNTTPGDLTEGVPLDPTGFATVTFQPATVTVGERYMLVLLDRTGSMNAIRQETGNTRCYDALQTAKDDVTGFTGSAIAVWTFQGTEPTNWTGGFVDKARALAALDALEGESCTGLTPLAKSMCMAVDALVAALPGAEPGQLILAVSSDGEENNSLDGDCAGNRELFPPYGSDPDPNHDECGEYDPESWEQKVCDKVLGNAVVFARYWGALGGARLATRYDLETGQSRGLGVPDWVFFQDLAESSGGAYTFMDDNAPPATGACCLSSGQCQEGLTAVACAGLSSVYHGDGSLCQGDGNGDGIDDACFAPMAEANACRYLTILPLQGSDPVALLVTGDPGDPNVSCVSSYVQADATLDANPVFQTPAQWGTVYVADGGLVAGATYSIQADFGAPGQPALTVPASATTRAWGDLNGDGLVNGHDLFIFVDAYLADLPYWTGDLCPEVPDRYVDGDDLLCWIDAYYGQPYPFTGCGGGAAAGGQTAGGPTVPPSLSEVRLALRPRVSRVKPRRPVSIDVLLEGARNVRLYQVAIDIDGGASGELVL